MNTLEAIASRRSIRQFDPKTTIPAEDERKLVEAALSAPSAFNLQHTHLVVARDPALRRQLQEAAYGQRQVSEASLYIVVCADTKAYQNHFETSTQGVPDAAKQARSQMVHSAYADNEQARRIEGVRSGSLAAENLMIAAKSLGYDSVPMVGFDMLKTAELIQLPEHFMIVMSIAVGKAVATAHPRTGVIPMQSLVHTNHF